LTQQQQRQKKDSPCEIHFHKIIGDSVEIEKKIQIVDKTKLSSKMYFNKTSNWFITFSDNDGLAIISLSGQIIFKNETLKANEYNIETGLFLGIDNKTISVYEITE
jgi:hypothetical protein